MFAQPFNFACFKMVYTPQHSEGAAGDQVRCLGAVVDEIGDALPNVLLHGVINQRRPPCSRIFRASGGNSRNDIIYQQWNISMHIGIFNHGRHSAAASMTQNEHYRCVDVAHSVFDGTDFIHIRHISGHPDREDIAYAGIKYDFNGHPGVGAAYNSCKGILPRRGVLQEPGPVKMGILPRRLVG